MSKQIILVNNSCPFGGESFLKNELDCSSSDTRIILFPIMPHGTTFPEGALPDNCHVSREALNLRPLDYAKAFARAVITLFLQKEWMVALQKHGAVRNIAKALRFAVMSESRVASISRVLPANEEGYLFYSYWMYECAYICAKLKMRYPNSVFVTRCHGFDLYEERHRNGFLPFRKLIIGNADKIFAISEDGKEYLEKHYSKDVENKVIISRLGTFDIIHDGGGKTESEKYFTMVSCSNMVPVKRLPFLIQALGKCKESIHWIHFGDGVQMEELQKQIETLPSNICCTFMGRVPNQEVKTFYAEHSIELFVNVSSYEGIPVSIMEAFSAAIPVLATDVGGTGELVKNESNGWLIPVTIPCEALAQMIDRIAQMPKEKANAMKLAARKTWQVECNAKKNYSEFYKSMEQIGV